jgi:parallel beta-helix repeat protein
MWKAMIRPNLLKIVFAIAIILTTIINLNANEAEKERLNSWIKARKEILAELDSLIAKGIPIDFGKMGLEAWEHTMDGGIRQIEFYYKFMTNGTKLTQKLGIDGVSKWWYKPKGGLSPKDVEWYKMAGQYTVTDADSLYFNKYKPIIIKKLYEFLNDENPLIQVAAAQSLIRMHITDPLIINKLKYYANRKNIKLWSHKINLDLYELYSKERTNEKAINILIRRAKNGLKKLNKNQEQYNLNKKTIKNLKRDLDWNGDISASYCIEWYGGEDPDNPIYNPSYTSYSADCCNFASQCLIAGYYDDIIPASASYPPDHVSPQGCITWCPDLHDYLSNRFDVVTTVVDFHTNGWENGTEPNNHIPDNFSVGDIAIVGFHVDGSGPYQGHYKHAIICHGYDGNGYELFGAHTTNNIDKTMTWFIYPDTTKWDYATFYHITNNWNCNTQIAGGAVSGTWTHENSPYCINGEITIPQGSQLTIEPGVNVIFTGHYKFNIYGRLVAEGDWQRYINFIPQNSFIGWHGLRFFDQNSNGQDISKVVYCKLQYGNAFGTSPDCNGGAIYLDNSDILIDNCIISNNTVIGGGGGVFIYNSSDPTIKRSIIRDNTSEAAGGGIYATIGVFPF